ncbi:MAG: 6-bladed beta-propeller [Tannerella sp.]|jgi:hypothetical protein|nr:6-bladed beta-propeller [Tannerella sp.]
MKQIIACIMLLSLFISYGCKEQTGNKTNAIFVDIDNISNDVSIFDIFDKVEIIPLETNDESLIKYITGLVCYNNNLYIFDYNLSKILAFDHSGKFLFSIDNRGQGPEQYNHISDFDIDKDNNKIIFVSAIDSKLHEYDMNGNFIRKYNLPESGNGAYKYIKYLNSDMIAFWTFDYNNRLKFYSKSKNRFVNECFPETDNFYRRISTPLFPYGNYLVRPVDNNIYELSADGKLSVAYTWDFGKLNIDLDKLVIPPVEKHNDARTKKILLEYMEKVRTSEIINCIFGTSGGNSDYIYTQVMRKSKDVNIFYDKRNQQFLIFEKTKENAYFYPVYWSEKFVIGFMPELSNIEQKRTVAPDTILDAENIERKNQYSEFDNPLLIKYYFKK